MRIPPLLVLIAGGAAIYYVIKHPTLFTPVLQDGQKLWQDLFEALTMDPLAGPPSTSDADSVIASATRNSSIRLPAPDISQISHPSSLAVEPPPAAAP